MKNKYDNLLKQGLTKLKNLEFAYISDGKEINYSFSEEYIRNKEHLIKNLGRPYWKFVNTVAKKAAVIIVALIIAFSSLMTVDAFREKVVDFIYKIYVTFTEISSDHSNTQTDLNVFYSIDNPPKQFTKDYTNIQTTKKSSTYWVNSTGECITFTQSVLTKSISFNSEYGELSERIINDTPCLICKDPNLYYCYWEFDGYRFELIYPLDLGEEFMSEVVGNLVEIDPDELSN